MNSFNKISSIGIGYKQGITLSLISIIALMIVPSTISESFADSEYNLLWQLVFIKNEQCGPNDTLDKVYAGITSKYFELYQLENTAYDINCMSESEYQDFQMNEDINLLILVYDENLGKKILHPNNLDGIYIHAGNDRAKNHLVIMCQCSDYDSGYERTLPSWILSHELSHFVLSYKGFAQSDIQNRIHDIEKEYDNCIGTNFQSSTCDEFKTSISLDSSAKDFVVITPYEPAVGNKIIKYIPDAYSDTEVIELQRSLAKMWITNSIDDDAYTNTLKHMIDPPIAHNSETHQPFMEIPNGFVIAEVSKTKDIEWNEYLNPETQNQDNLSNLLNYIPFNLEEQVEESSLEKMPNWFKTRALLWSEKRISDKVFFDGVEHLVRLNILKLN
jgi:hypothetical protein